MTEWLIVIFLFAIFLCMFYNYVVKTYNSECTTFFDNLVEGEDK